MSNENELARCPFCAGEGSVHWNMATGEGFIVVCNDGCLATTGLPRKTEAEAIAAWNRRAEPAPSSPVVGWRPIETAPKDGTEVILGREGRIMVGEYNVRMGRFKSWLTSHGLEHPTHWMPLPAAPAHREVGE